MSAEEIRHRFKHHPPTDEAVAMHTVVRKQCTDLALSLWATLPDSREKSLALTALQEAAMWSNAAIALHISGEQTEPPHGWRYKADEDLTSDDIAQMTSEGEQVGVLSNVEMFCPGCTTRVTKRPYPEHANPHWIGAEGLYSCLPKGS